MTKENERKNGVNSVLRKKELQEAFQRGLSLGLKKGRIEGMLAYQKRLIENLQRDNASLNQKLQEIKK